MFLSAEIRWFWSGHCPQPVRDWFFTAGLPPGGGQQRIDRYLLSGNDCEIAIKQRGDKPGFEIKGLVAVRELSELEPLADHCELWCKWSIGAAGLNLTREMATTKTRWIRKFDTSAPVRTEIALDRNENVKFGHASPAQGCNVELTEVKVSNRCDVWWTLGFEAFGDLDSVPTNLIRAVLSERDSLANIVSTGTPLSYPTWLRARSSATP